MDLSKGGGRDDFSQASYSSSDLCGFFLFALKKYPESFKGLQLIINEVERRLHPLTSRITKIGRIRQTATREEGMIMIWTSEIPQVDRYHALRQAGLSQL
jgi:hypothetical protein